jgi:hypothetical protein
LPPAPTKTLGPVGTLGVMKPDRHDHARGHDDPAMRSARARARDVAVRRTRGILVGVAAGAVALSGVFSVVAAQAFKGHSQRPATTSPDPAPATTGPDPAPASGTRVPGPDHIPSISGDPAPLQPPEQPPAADPQTTAPAPAPAPQVSGGS